MMIAININKSFEMLFNYLLGPTDMIKLELSTFGPEFSVSDRKKDFPFHNDRQNNNFRVRYQILSVIVMSKELTSKIVSC
jgi:hypothetical protein